MKYLVTGGCGFIGSHLTDVLLQQGHEVIVLDNLSSGFRHNLSEAAQLVVADVTDPGVTKEMMLQVDGCFHLAAVASVERSINDWVGTHRINQQGTVNILDGARATSSRKAIPVVFASSAAIYGNNASTPLAENAQPSPVSAYGADKLGSELHAKVAWLVHGIPTVGMRFFNVYGPRQNPDSPYSGVISIFIDRILRGMPLSIYGDGNQTRDFVYVADVVNYLNRAMDKLRGNSDIFNVCTGHSTSIRQLAKVLSLIANQELQIDFKPARNGDISTSLGEPKKALTKLGIKAETTLGEGLKETLLSIQNNNEN